MFSVVAFYFYVYKKRRSSPPDFDFSEDPDHAVEVPVLLTQRRNGKIRTPKVGVPTECYRFTRDNDSGRVSVVPPSLVPVSYGTVVRGRFSKKVLGIGVFKMNVECLGG